MADVILILNAGSSSVKFSVFDAGDSSLALLLRGQAEGLFTAPSFIAQDARGAELYAREWEQGRELGHGGAISFLIEFLREHRGNHRLVAVGHRVMHGGDRYTQPVRVEGDVVSNLEKLTPLAPLHQPHNLKLIDIVTRLRPDLPQVACFDTAFHRTQPDVARAYALPPAITQRGVKRYGFHGLSYEYIASVLPQMDPKAATGRTIVAHLGNGSSMCALVNGRSVASTMGFTAVDGLPMGTRSGNLDPGVVLYLMQALQMQPRAIEDLLYQKSGLLGVSGISSDMRTLLASDEPRARFAVALYTYRIARELGSLAAAAHGVDAVVFTAGIGERSAVIRERVCKDAAWLGLSLDARANQSGGPCISPSGSAVSVWAIPTDEELMMARHTLSLSSGASRPAKAA